MLKPESNQAVENFFSAVDTEFNTFLHDRKPEEYQAAAQLILDSQAQGGRIHVTGIGKCSHVATYVASLLSSTGNPNSWLAKNTDAFLYAGVHAEGGPLNRAPRNSVLAEMLTLQALSVALQAEKDWDPIRYVRCHPGGALGQLRDGEK